MASTSPNPKEGDDVEEGLSRLSESEEKRQQRVPVSHFPSAASLPSRLTYVPVQFSDPNVPGPSGIKQCFRTVKTCRRIPTLPNKPPPTQTLTFQPTPSTSSKSPPQVPAKPEKQTKKSRKEKQQVKNHVCHICEKRFSSPGKLNQHLLSHTGELPFGCDCCDKKFNSKFKLDRHNLIHSEARAFSCPICERSFNRKDHLNNHLRVHNPSKKVYTCDRPSCRKQYTSLLSFKKHAALHSAEEGNLTCRICNRQFETREEIVFHLKVHSGSRTVKNETDKKFTCSYCGRKFFTGKDVRRHLVVHTGRRDFVCQFCPQKFGRKDHLVRHVKNAHAVEQWHTLTTQSTIKAEEETSEDIVQYIDFPLAPGELEALLEADKSDERSSDVEIKIEPDLVKLETPEQQQTFEEVQPTPGSSRDFPSSVVYVVPQTFQSPSESELDYLRAQQVNVGSDLSRVLVTPDLEDIINEQQILELLRSDQMLEESPQTVLPAFTQAFHSAQSPKPPQPPPPSSK